VFAEEGNAQVVMAITEDADTILDAIAYVAEVHEDLTLEHGAPPLGPQNQVVEAILADADFATYVRNWAERNRELEAQAEPRIRPPIDEVYRRAAAMLRADARAMVRPWRGSR
jgi:hypothetical protein